MILHSFETAIIANHYLPALINGDVSGLDDQEEQDLSAWENEIRMRASQEFGIPLGMTAISYSAEECEAYFGRDEISGLLAMVQEIEIYIHDARGSKARGSNQIEQISIK